MWQIAGAAGITDPYKLTLRELLAYADGHRRAAWDHTAYLLLTTVRCHCKGDYTLRDFHPYMQDDPAHAVTAETYQAMRNALPPTLTEDEKRAAFERALGTTIYGKRG